MESSPGDREQVPDDRLAVLAHELRNPLATMRTAAELLAHHGERDPELRRIGEVVLRQTAVMQRLVDELLDVSRLDAGRLKLRMQPLDLRDVARDAIADHRSRLERAGLSCRLSLFENPAPVLGDASKLGQVLGNLLGNALKFTPTPGSVDVAVRVDGGCALLEVRDTGIGMTPDLLGVVFDRYRQARRGSAGGLGLGLPIAKELAELHGGSIGATSEGPGTGSTVTLRLPVIRNS